MNLSGLPGHNKECDYVNEYLNRLLEDIIKHKDTRFEDTFIRDVISRNLRHLALLKKAWREKLGLKSKSGKHSEPHQNPELRILLDVYRKEEIHKRRAHRSLDSRDTDDFDRGFQKLRDGALAQFLKRSRQNDQGGVQEETIGPQYTDIPDTLEDDEDELPEIGALFATRGSISMVNGSMVVNATDAILAVQCADVEEEGDDDDDEYMNQFSVLDHDHDMSDDEGEM